MSLIVQKFGGTSVRDAERVMNVAKIVTDTYAKGNDVVVVVSAQGDFTDVLVEKQEDEIVIRVTGRGFLYNMVRILTGTLIEVGRGKRLPEEIPGIIDAMDRGAAGFTAPAQGLYLIEVTYK